MTHLIVGAAVLQQRPQQSACVLHCNAAQTVLGLVGAEHVLLHRLQRHVACVTIYDILMIKTRNKIRRGRAR